MKCRRLVGIRPWSVLSGGWHRALAAVVRLSARALLAIERPRCALSALVGRRVAGARVPAVAVVEALNALVIGDVALGVCGLGAIRARDALHALTRRGVTSGLSLGTGPAAHGACSATAARGTAGGIRRRLPPRRPTQLRLRPRRRRRSPPWHPFPRLLLLHRCPRCRRRRRRRSIRRCRRWPHCRRCRRPSRRYRRRCRNHPSRVQHLPRAPEAQPTVVAS